MPRHLIAVTGATATGKTETAVTIAENLMGEVVSADAYQVYLGLDIGTAKPSLALRSRVAHHLIDVTTPAEPMTLARYLDLAHESLEDVWSRGRLPVLAGGSGQYVWALLEGWQVPRLAPDESLREELAAFATQHGPKALYARLVALDPGGAAHLDAGNVRRVIRALELVTRTGQPLAACQVRTPLDADILVLGLRYSRAELDERIDARVDAMFAAGLVDEVRALRERGWGDSVPVRNAIGYKEVSAHLDGKMALNEAETLTKTATRRLARNQGAWFKGNDARIVWVDAGPDAPEDCQEVIWEWLGRM
jgi:tRNA dimethylallyltransferase